MTDHAAVIADLERAWDVVLARPMFRQSYSLRSPGEQRELDRPVSAVLQTAGQPFRQDPAVVEAGDPLVNGEGRGAYQNPPAETGDLSEE